VEFVSGIIFQAYIRAALLMASFGNLRPDIRQTESGKFFTPRRIDGKKVATRVTEAEVSNKNLLPLVPLLVIRNNE
jgi:hypothetical protein